MQVQIITTVLLAGLTTSVFGTFNDLYCEESVFYKPYVRLYLEQDGFLIFEITSGFQTLHSATDLYMCINGPAFVYKNMSSRENERLFSNAKFGMFIHQCFHLNQQAAPPKPKNNTNPDPDINPDAEKSLIPGANGRSLTNGKTDPASKEVKVTAAAGHPLCDPKPTIEPTLNAPPMPNLARKIYGVYLLSEGEDYRNPLFTVFPDKSYEIYTDLSFPYNMSIPPPREKTIVYGSSIVQSGNENNCLGSHSVSQPRGLVNGTNRICFRKQMPEDTTWDAAITNGTRSSHTTKNLTLTVSRGSGGGGGSCGGSPDVSVVNPNNTDTANSTNTTDSTALAPTGRDAANNISTVTTNTTNAGNITTNGTNTTEPIVTPTSATSEVVLGDCAEFPDFRQECVRKRPDVNLTCTITKILMGAETPVYPNDYIWHTGILGLVREIFNKACPWISPYFTSAISSLTEYYAMVGDQGTNAAAKFNGAKRPYYAYLEESMTHCRDLVEPMTFNNVSYSTVNTFKKDIRFNNRTGSNTNNTSPVRLFYFREEADREYRFNRILEMNWIMFATVLGICPRYYDTKTASTSSRLYTMFTEDFFTPLSSVWTDPTHNKIYEFLMGNFVNNEIHYQALSCLEASFVQSNTVAYRFQRPLIIGCDKDDNSFLELPTQQFYHH